MGESLRGRGRDVKNASAKQEEEERGLLARQGRVGDIWM